MADIDTIHNAIRAADAAGDANAVRKLGAYLQTLTVTPERPSDPTEGMTGLQKLGAGFGKALVDVSRGGGQLMRQVLPERAANAMGLPTQGDIDEAKRLDAPLMRSGAAQFGNTSGKIAAAIPAMAFGPGIGAATATGAAMGAMEPVASGESRLSNMALGSSGGVGGALAGRSLNAAARGVGALVEPFTAGGPARLARDTAERFGIKLSDLANVTDKASATGARPTLAEQIQRSEGAAAASRLQDAIRSSDPEIAAKFAAREVENNAARVNSLRDLAGGPEARDFADAMRQGTAKDLYGEAFAKKMDYSKLSPAERGEVTKLLKTPAIRDAMKDAQTIAANKGINLNKPDGSIEGLHLTKLAMDDAIANAGSSANQANKATSIRTARDRLVTFIERMSPDYETARTTYAEMSRLVNQGDVAQELFKRGTSPLSDLAGNPRLMPGQLANALSNEPRVIKQATGRDLNTTLSDLLDPDQYAKLRAVADESARSAAVARAANGPGSPTAQRIASQNVMRQVLGPFGLPQSWAESTLANTAARPLNFVYSGVAEPKIQRVLADFALNPESAKQAFAIAQRNPEALRPEVRAALPYLNQILRTTAPAMTLNDRR